MTSDTLGDQVTLSLRECRLIVERLLHVAGLPSGLVSRAREFAIAAQVLGMDALAVFDERLEEITPRAGARVEIVEETGPVVVVDCLDQSVLAVGPSLTDVLVATAGRRGSGVVLARNARHVEFLAAATATTHHYGLDASTLEILERGPVLTRYGDEDPSWPSGGTRPVGRAGLLVARPNAAPAAACTEADRLAGLTGSAIMSRAARDGISVSWGRWRRLYEQSQHALSEDTPVSRRHAGATMIDEQGRIHGEEPEEFDLDIYLGAAQPPENDGDPRRSTPCT